MAAITRAKRPEIKIPVKDFNELTTYCKGTEGDTPTKIICNLVSEFIAREDVQAVIAAQSKDKRLLKQIEKKRATIEKEKAELAELEAKLKQGWFRGSKVIIVSINENNSSGDLRNIIKTNIEENCFIDAVHYLRSILPFSGKIQDLDSYNSSAYNTLLEKVKQLSTRESLDENEMINITNEIIREYDHNIMHGR